MVITIDLAQSFVARNAKCSTHLQLHRPLTLSSYGWVGVGFVVSVRVLVMVSKFVGSAEVRVKVSLVLG